MRIACIHLPAFPLQVEIRQRPELAGRPVAVFSRGVRPSVSCCSRAAHAAGIRSGMAPLAARALAADLVVVEPAEARWRAALVDLAGELAGLSPVVEVPEGGSSIQLEVPAGKKSAEIGRALSAAVASAGYRARIGIAGDRFTACAAARFGGGEPVTVVKRGQSAAFLAPLPIELLPLAPEVRSMLRAAGVGTLGAFAALPPPSVELAGAVDYRELARGNGPTELVPFRAMRARSRGTSADGRQLRL